MNLDTRQFLLNLRKPNNPPAGDSRILPAEPSGNPYWRCVLLHDMTDAEEQDTHNVYIDLIDEQGERLKPTTNPRIRHGWDNMATDVGELFAPCEKIYPEPLANVGIFRGATVWVQVDDRGRHSDRVGGFNSNPDGHESFYVVFQLVNPSAISVDIHSGFDAIIDDLEAKLQSALLDVRKLRGER